MKKHDFTHINKGIEMSPSMVKYVQDAVDEKLEALIIADCPSAEAGDIIVISGCEWDVSGTTYTMTAGKVLYNGELCTVDAFEGESVAGTVGVYKEVVYTYAGEKAFFGDSVFRDVLGTRKMVVEMGDPDSGIANFNGSNVKLKLRKKVLNIGDFNMNIFAIRTLPHGLGLYYNKIVDIKVKLIGDDGIELAITNNRRSDASLSPVISQDETNVYIFAGHSDFSSSANWDGNQNRGIVIIEYGDI